jgi:hypothetical protein
LVRVLEVRQKVRILDDVAWRLWWEDGGSPPPAVRARLLRVAEIWERESQRLAVLLAEEDYGDPGAEAEMEAAYRSLEAERLPPALSRIAQNVGRHGLPTVFRVLAEAWSGTFEGYEDAPGEEGGRGELVERALGIDRARVDRILGDDPWFEGDSADDMRKLSGLMGGRSLTHLAEAEDAELTAAREQVRALVRLILSGTAVVEQIFGSAAFGFGTVGAVIRAQADEEEFLLLMGLALRGDDEFRERMESFLSTEAEAEALLVLYEGFVRWREEIPAFAEVLSDDSLAAALQHPSAASRANEDLAHLCDEHRPAVDRFLADNVELTAAISVFGTNSREP